MEIDITECGSAAYGRLILHEIDVNNYTPRGIVLHHPDLVAYELEVQYDDET